jgi:hypothetical protein
MTKMKPLTPAMQKLYDTALRVGYVDPIEHGRKTRTIVGLMERGLIREARGRAGKHYLATDRDHAHSLAWIEALERNWAEGNWPHWTEESFRWFIQRLRVEWSIQ